jgi:hypothetical protein
MADLGSIAAIKAAWDAVVNNTVPDESIEPDDHNQLIDDLLDTTAGLDKVLRHNAETGGYDLTVTAGDLIRLADSGFFADIDTATLTADRTITFQDASGTVAFLSDIVGGVTELNDLTDVNTGLPVSPTQADDGKMLFFDTSVGDFITDDTVTHGTSVINGKKASAGTIAKGKPVYLVGFDSDLHTVEEANATSGATMPVIGFAAETMDNTNSKHIMTFGKLTGIDTSIYSVGDDLYIDTTTGALTTTRPTGTALIQRVAKVLRSDVSGGQLLIFNTARTAGLPNLPQNNFWIGDSNAEPQANTAAQARTVLNVADGANNYSHPNHTGEVTSTGDGAQVLDKTAISNRTDVTMDATDILLFGDTTDPGNLKKGAVQDIIDLAGGGATEVGTGTGSLQKVGDGANAAGDYSVALGRNAITVGDGDISIGDGAGGGSTGIYNTAIGLNTFASNTSAVAMGESCIANKIRSTAIGGFGVQATGDYATSIGGQTGTASGLHSARIGGFTCTASGDKAGTFAGSGLVASGIRSAVIAGENGNTNSLLRAIVLGGLGITADRADTVFAVKYTATSGESIFKGSGTGSGTYSLTLQNSASTNIFRARDNGVLNAPNLPTYADDTAAGVGGLVTGDLYVETTSGNRYVASKS